MVLCDDDGGDFIQILLWWKLLFVVDGEYIVFHTASHEGELYTNNIMPVYIDDPLVLLSLSSFLGFILVRGCFCSVAVNCQPLNFEKGFC